MFFILFSASLGANDNPGPNMSGFPRSLREASECLFGNYKALLGSLEENILVNNYRIQILRKASLTAVSAATSRQSGVITSEIYNRRRNVLVDTNKGLAIHVSHLKGKCKNFPTWD